MNQNITVGTNEMITKKTIRDDIFSLRDVGY